MSTSDGKIRDPEKMEVKTLDENAQPVRERFPSVDAMRHMYSTYRRAMLPIFAADARVIAVHRGVPPYDQDKINGIGQGWRANLNTMELKGSVNHRADAAYDFHMDLDTRIRVSIRPEFQEMQSPNPLLDYGQIIAEEYTYLLNNDWPENYFLIDQTTRDRVKLGLGIATWPDHYDWRPVYVPKSHFYTDPLYTPLADKLPACCLRDSLEVADLLKVVDFPDKHKDLGWDPKLVREVIVDFWQTTGFGSSQAQPSDAADEIIGGWAAFERWRASRPADVATFELKKLPVIRALIVSVSSGKVSHYIDVDSATVTRRTDDFLYKRIDQFDDMSHAIWLNPYTFSEGTVGSLDGLGHDLTPYCEISNRMLCTALDGGIMSGGLLLQAQQGFDGDELSVLRVGPTTIIPPTLAAVQSSFTPPIEKLLELRSAVRGVYANNVGLTRMNPELMEQAARGTRSKDEVILERNREFRLETNSANFEYMMWTRLHREMFRRMMKVRTMSDSIPGAKEVKKFVQRCLNRGVPETLFANYEEALMIEVNRAVGDGSPQARTQIWQNMMALRGEMDEAGRRHVLREYTASLIGYRNVDSLFPLRNRDKIPTNEHSIATLENNDFREGSYIPAGSDQIHVIHINIHLDPILQVVQTYSQEPDRMDKQYILAWLSAALPHIQDHVRFLARDASRKPIVKKVTAILKELVVFYEQIQKDVAADADEQEKLALENQQRVMDQLRRELDGEAQVKLRKVELDAQIEAMRQEALAEVRREKARAQEEIKRAQAEARAELERSIAEGKLALAEMVAQREQDRKDRQAEQ